VLLLFAQNIFYVLLGFTNLIILAILVKALILYKLQKNVKVMLCWKERKNI